VVDDIRIPAPKRQNLATTVAKVLKRHILLQRLEPGDRLPPERRLAEALNVSRTVLREALSQLVGEGLIYRSPRAILVREFDRTVLARDLAPIDDADTEVQDLIELRAILEIGAIEAIVHRATPAHLAEIERYVVECERRLAANESIIWADARFHSALLRTLGNRSVDAFVPLIEENLRHTLYITPRQLTTTGTSEDHRVVTEHRQIYEAIRRREPEEAVRTMEGHIAAARDLVIERQEIASPDPIAARKRRN
jgi:DNA-binding FadR family transcriptional regulator